MFGRPSWLGLWYGRVVKLGTNWDETWLIAQCIGSLFNYNEEYAYTCFWRLTYKETVRYDRIWVDVWKKRPNPTYLLLTMLPNNKTTGLKQQTEWSTYLTNLPHSRRSIFAVVHRNWLRTRGVILVSLERYFHLYSLLGSHVKGPPR